MKYEFVKASEFKYEPRKTYYAKWPSGTVIKGTGRFQESDGTFFWNEQGYMPVLKKEHEQLLILDESCPPPVSAEVVSHADVKQLDGIKAIEYNGGTYLHRDYVANSFAPRFIQKLLREKRLAIVDGNDEYFKTISGEPTDMFDEFIHPSPSAPVVAEQVAQWAVNNRYPKSEFDKVSDHEFYHTLLDKINALSTPPQEGEPGEISTIERYIQLRKKHGNVEALRILQTEYANQSMQEGDAKAIAEAAFEAGYVSFLNNWKV